ncbi:ATP-binding protein [Massilia sp. H6]|uniref:ATP-binding protein n=1 Tax=Massilia sp. H6 TaxID=2970464 RepID=UPI0021693F5F|nr:ATP-binding protein [Massilia sp. H6]UVW29805.1 ATP-binding protein [Massilia sp. H6]
MSAHLDYPLYQPAPASSHFVRFYQGDLALLTEVAEFIDQGLDGGGTGIIIATAEHAQALQQQLMGLASLKGRRWSAEQLLVLDAGATLARIMVDDWPDEQLFGIAVGDVVRATCAPGTPVQAFGEMVALLCARGLYDAAVRLEQYWNTLAQECRFALFCAYPWQQFSTTEEAVAFRRICAAHDHVCGGVHAGAAHESAQDVARQLAIAQQHNRALQGELERARQAEAMLRQRERELMDFLENAAESLHRVGPDGTILWANKAELALLGYRWDQYVGHHIAEFHADAEVIASILDRLQRGQTLQDEPARLLCSDGTIRHVVISSNACFENGSLRYTRCFTRDATERHLLAQLHREREDLVTELSQSNRAKDEFLAMLAHELRNPLAPVSSAAQMLAIMADDPQRVRYAAGVITRQVRHMTGLIDDLLDVARVTRGLVVLDRSPIDLRTLVADAVEQVAPLAQARRQRVQLDLPADPVLVNADPKRIIQVLANIVSNANKFTPDGGSIAIQLRADGADVELAVTDTGIGMDPALAAQVFDLFVQGGRTLARTQGGLGLGLALARSLVELHGGTIAAASLGAGLGSTFSIRLPRLAGHAGDAGSCRPAPASTAGHPLRVMVVDDNRDAADALAALLSAFGHDAQAVYSSAAALAAAATRCPQVFLLDIGLPDMDGLALAARLRAMPQAADVPLVAVTGYHQPRDRERSRQAGFDHHLAKPVDTDVLLAILADIALQASRPRLVPTGQ